MKAKNRDIFKKWKRTLVLPLACTLLFSSVAPQIRVHAQETEVESAVKNVSLYNMKYNSGKSLQPTAPAFSMFSLMDWSPEKDPDGQINRARIPLKEDIYRGNEVNPKATKNAEILSCTISNWNHDEGSSVGGDDPNIYAFDFWQYTDIYVYWNGSGNGMITVPTPDIIDAAHRNGVKVHALLGFPYGYSENGMAQIRKMVEQDEEGNYPVMQKLIDLARHFGFDGYFYNQETSGLNEEDAKKLRDAMIWFRKKAPELTNSWYDAMLPDGRVSYQNALNDRNKWWMEEVNGVRAVDYMFLNYNWYGNQITDSYQTAKDLGVSPFDVYAGLNLEKHGVDARPHPLAKLAGSDGKTRVSIGLFRAELVKEEADTLEAVHKKEEIFYVGPNGDPTVSTDGEVKKDKKRWTGMSRFVGDHTAVTTLPFYTDFNSGHGYKYFKDGVRVREKGWNSRFIQKMMPTWRWWIRDEASAPLKGGYDFVDAYNGGNSVKFTGKLKEGSKQDIMLYSTHLRNVNDSTLLVTHKVSDEARVYLGMRTSETYDGELKMIPLSPSNGEWVKTEVSLRDVLAETDVVYSLSLHVESDREVNNFQLNLGELGIFNERLTPESVTGAKVEEAIVHSAVEAEARIRWEDAKDADYYEVYQDNAFGERSFINATTNNIFYTDGLRRSPVAEGTSSKIYIVPVSEDGTRGKETEVFFDWGMKANETDSIFPESGNLCLGAQVTEVSEQGDSATGAMTIDGSLKTKWWASNKWVPNMQHVAIKLKEMKTVRRVKIFHAQAGGEGPDLNTAKFHLEYKSAAGQWIRAEEIDGDAPKAVTETYLSEPITSDEFKLVIDKCGPSPWSAVNIYEWEMFETLPKTDYIPRGDVVFDGKARTVAVKEVPAGMEVNLYYHRADLVPFETKKNETAQAADLLFENIDVTKVENGTLYYDTKQGIFDKSVRLNTIDPSLRPEEPKPENPKPEQPKPEAEYIPVPVPTPIETVEPAPEETKPEVTVEEDKTPSSPVEKEPADGDILKADNNEYKVVSAEKKTVELVKLEKVGKKASFPSTVKIDGVSYRVTEVADKAFQDMRDTESLVIGKYVTAIGKQAFKNCKNLKMIIFKGRSVKKISKSAFSGIKTVLSVKVPKTMKKAERARLVKLFKQAGVDVKIVTK